LYDPDVRDRIGVNRGVYGHRPWGDEDLKLFDRLFR
jgi:hypothetical protein